MSVPSELENELEKEFARSQKLLCDFLTVDLDIAFTFLNIARPTSDPEHRKSALEKTKIALRSIRVFLERVQTPYSRMNFTKRADDLEKALSQALFR